MLSSAQVEQYHRDGFLVVEGFADEEACRSLRERAVDIVRSWEPGEQRSVFTTDEQERQSTDEFLESAGGVWCFFESEAFGDDGELRQAKELSINKIGHAQHDLDPVFRTFTYRPELAEVATEIGLVEPLVLQSMYIFKQPGIGGEVGCHQDATFLYTDPISVTGFWFALEDATIENGCMWAAPGGHRTSLRKQFRRTAPGSDELTEFVELDPTPLPSPADLVPLEVPAGTLVVLHGLLPHWSDVNRSPASRHAYTVHCISGTAEYPAWNWLQRPADMPLQRLDAVAA
ncbi:MAG TPA: phytanoyl-CoA dioxygenase family protein [Ilumatobacteraceae bacterium]